jgi:hypothetical protein
MKLLIVARLSRDTDYIPDLSVMNFEEYITLLTFSLLKYSLM